MKRIAMLAGIFLMGILAACAPKTVEPVTEPVAAQAPIKPVEAKESWKIEWEKLLREAKKEGSVVVASGFDADTRVAVNKGAKDRLNLTVEWVVGQGTEQAAKILAERRAGLYLFDVYLGGANTALTSFKPVGAFAHLKPLLILPEVLDEKGWFSFEGKGLPWVDKDETIFKFWSYPSVSVAINTNLVKKDEIKSYRDLLNPKWKGKILIEDTTSFGSAGRWAGITGVYFKELGWEFHRALAKQEPLLTTNRRLLGEWLAQGKYAIAVGAITEPVKLRDMGAPIDTVIPKEGTYDSSGFGNLAVFDRAPHPRAAQVFANWMLTREAQEITSRARQKQSARTDIPIDYLPAQETREYVFKMGGILITPPDEEFNEVLQRVMAKEIKEIWGPLTGR